MTDPTGSATDLRPRAAADPAATTDTVATTTGTTSATRDPADAARPPAPQVWPTLRARDARALIRFLVDAFGFEEVVSYGEGDQVQHAQLAGPSGGGIMLGSLRDDPDDAWRFTPGSFACYVVTDQPDALCARAVAAGAELVDGPHDTDYGSRDFAARDPEGNLWFFGTYPGEPRPPR